MTPTPTLTRSARDLLERLLFRADLGQAYLVQAGRGRVALVAPQMGRDAALARIKAYNWPTIRALIDEKLIEVPDGHTELQFAYRERLDSNAGERITITTAGRAAAGEAAR